MISRRSDLPVTLDLLVASAAGVVREAARFVRLASDEIRRNSGVVKHWRISIATIEAAKGRFVDEEGRPGGGFVGRADRPGTRMPPRGRDGRNARNCGLVVQSRDDYYAG